MHSKCPQLGKEGRWLWCQKFKSHTNPILCRLCQTRGEEYIKDLFDRRDGRKKLEPSIVAPKRSRGLGDTIAKVIHKMSGGRIEPCGSCKKRQAWFNEHIPYKRVI